VIDVLVLVGYLATGALALFGIGLTVADRPPGRELRWAVLAVTALLAVQAVIAAVRVFGGVQLPETSTFLIYLGVSVCVLPVAHQWATAEPGRWSGAVVAVAAIGTAVAIWRLQDLWAAGVG
jgi:hypothetical protein